MGLRTRCGLMAIIAVVAASAVTACGSSSSKSSTTAGAKPSTTSGSQTSAASTSVAFDSPEAKLPSSYQAPTIKKGVTFKLGYLLDQAGVGTLEATLAGVRAEVKALGGSIVVETVNVDPTTQAADFKALLAQHVTAFALQPIDPPALGPLIKQAVAAKVPVVALDAPAIPGPLLPGYVSDVMGGLDRCAYLNVQAVAQAKPHATYALIPSGLPVPALQDLILREKYWAARFGLKYAGSVTTGPATDAASGSTAMSAIIARFPNVNAVLTYYDAVAEGAATTQATRAGGHIMVVGLAGDPAAVTEIRQGRMFATCGETNERVGQELAIAAYDEQTHQHLPLPKEVVIPSYEITKSNGRGPYAGG